MQTQDKKQTQHQLLGISKTPVLTKEVKNRQDDFRRSLEFLTNPINEEQMVQQSLQDYVEEEWTDICVRINRNDYLKLQKDDQDSQDEGNDDDDEEDLNKQLKRVRFVFAILLKDYFMLYKDLHMGKIITSFKREDIEFADMGTCIYIKENSEKFYYIKMIHHNREKKTRDIYLLAIAEP